MKPPLNQRSVGTAIAGLVFVCLVATSVGCADTVPAPVTPHSEKQQCGEIEEPCLTGHVCVYDDEENCKRCVCAPQNYSPPTPDLRVASP